MAKKKVRNLVCVFGDQLNRDASAFDGFDSDKDAVWMAEVEAEATYAPSHKQRIALFLSAMRHFRDDLKNDGFRVHYTELESNGNTGKLSSQLAQDLKDLKPERVLMTEPGEYRILKGMQVVCGREGYELVVMTDRHFFCSIEEFNTYAEGRKSLVMEFFYREMRKRHDILMEHDGKTPTGEQWNFDKDNRQTFGKNGPQDLPESLGFKPDAVTKSVLQLVERKFPDHPGSLDPFRWPVTPRQGKKALDDFIAGRLPLFGKYQDAMWDEEPFLYHSLLGAAMNLKLLDPREVVHAAATAYAEGKAPLAAVEGFIRQIIGWREYVRGIYWRFMPEYLEMNEMEADQPLPEFFWTGETSLSCLKHTITDTLKNGYAHHIQRLMVTGLYTLLLGVKPQEVESWYLGIYVDAVEWVTLPNTLGMSQYGDGGIMASKPYIATGKYIQRMGNYCSSCPKNPGEATGDNACPFTTLYWDYLMRHEGKLSKNQRMSLQVRNLKRLSEERKVAIREQAERIKADPAFLDN